MSREKLSDQTPFAPNEIKPPPGILVEMRGELCELLKKLDMYHLANWVAESRTFDSLRMLITQNAKNLQERAQLNNKLDVLEQIKLLGSKFDLDFEEALKNQPKYDFQFLDIAAKNILIIVQNLLRQHIQIFKIMMPAIAELSAIVTTDDLQNWLTLNWSVGKGLLLKNLLQNIAKAPENEWYISNVYFELQVKFPALIAADVLKASHIRSPAPFAAAFTTMEGKILLSSLFCAIDDGDDDLAPYILNLIVKKHGHFPFIINRAGDISRPGSCVPLLAYAITENCINAAKFILRKAEQVYGTKHYLTFDINAKYHDQTALDLAVKLGDFNLICEILKHNPDVNLNAYLLNDLILSSKTDIIKFIFPALKNIIQNSEGKPYLLMACQKKLWDIIPFFLNKKGIDLNTSKLTSFVSQGPAAVGETPLISAAMGGEAKIVSLLLENKAKVNLQGAFYGLNALMLSVACGHSAIVEQLLNAGADPYLKNAQQKNSFDLIDKNEVEIKKAITRYLKKYEQQIFARLDGILPEVLLQVIVNDYLAATGPFPYDIQFEKGLDSKEVSIWGFANPTAGSPQPIALPSVAASHATFFVANPQPRIPRPEDASNPSIILQPPSLGALKLQLKKLLENLGMGRNLFYQIEGLDDIEELKNFYEQHKPLMVQRGMMIRINQDFWLTMRDFGKSLNKLVEYKHDLEGKPGPGRRR